SIREKIFGLAQPLSCVLDLSKKPDPSSQMSVLLDRQPIPQSSDNGWDFDSAEDPKHVRIFGEYCDRIQRLRYSTCVATYSCSVCQAVGLCQ
ncbi:MAG TPA: hypothetical protein VF518_12670, partial [Polyangia bacterium]